MVKAKGPKKTPEELAKIRSENFRKAREAKMAKLKGKKEVVDNTQAYQINVPQEEDYTYDYSYEEEEEEEPEQFELEMPEEPEPEPTPRKPKAQKPPKAPKAQKAPREPTVMQSKPEKNEMEELRQLILGLTKKPPAKKKVAQPAGKSRKSNRTTINIVNPTQPPVQQKPKDTENDFMKKALFLKF